MPSHTAPLRRAARALTLAAALLPLAPRPATSQPGQPALAQIERRIREQVAADTADQIAFLARVVNVNSGSLNVAGVRQVGDVFRAAFDSLGFTTRWVDMPASMNRAGHLVAEHRGKPGGKRLLLIGHLDTVFEGEGQQFVRTGNTARGAGTSDMKGGDAIILYALRAMQRAGVLADANVTVVLTGDEELPGAPLSLARRDLIELAKRSDAALSFEGGNKGDAVVARRGFSSWVLRVTGKQGHSSGVFGQSAGFGAIYEAARILTEFQREFSKEPNLTVNPGVIVGGTDVAFDSARVTGTTAGKLNIVARSVVVPGDLRFLSEEQKARTRERMRAIIAANLPGTSAEISFQDEYPAMSPTAGNYALLAAYDTVSRALGHGPVVAFDPGRRGAGDVSFVAPYVDGLDGLGALGSGSHSPEESVDLAALRMQTERAALLVYRLSRQAPSVRK